jgi:neurofibromin 1
MLRVTTKNENSAFHPNNVEYALYSNFQELQTCFQRDTLKLPKDTLSSISDIRFMFRMIRLSKSKGKVEVIIKVGTHFVQVTTKKKQEILSGLRLSTTINDIFRLDDIDEAPAVIQNEDDSTFGLRADGGKIVMCFTSPQKADVLQALRSAKARCGKDVRPHKPLGRLIRPQDVPGTLLNLSFMNLSSSNHKLRLSSYNLLGALCRAFKFKTVTRLVCSLGKYPSLPKSLCIQDMSTNQ